ncbi:MAG: outer-membrane lipoprotein carrier protein LolA [Campylobacterales bacterium]|nr:outer-membrane lipoprotein carrier protein LolA [Campylobacterales bacterium]
MKLLWAIPLLMVGLNAEITLPENFESNFEQTVTNEKGKAIHYEGNVVYRYNKYVYINSMGKEIEITNGLFKWHYASPTQKEVCSDGMQIVVIDHDLEQISKYIIDEGFDLEKILKVAQETAPLEYKATYQDVVYHIILDANRQLSKISYIDNMDNRVDILFRQMHYNIPSFDETKLECPINSDYDVIEG